MWVFLLVEAFTIREVGEPVQIHSVAVGRNILHRIVIPSPVPRQAEHERRIFIWLTDSRSLACAQSLRSFILCSG